MTLMEIKVLAANCSTLGKHTFDMKQFLLQLFLTIACLKKDRLLILARGELSDNMHSLVNITSDSFHNCLFIPIHLCKTYRLFVDWKRRQVKRMVSIGGLVNKGGFRSISY